MIGSVKRHLINELAKPLTKRYSIQLTVRRFFTNVDLAVVAKGAVPASLQVDYPFYIWGDFDRVGGYRIGNIVKPAKGSIQFIGQFVFGNSVPFNQFSGLADLYNNIQYGDVVQMYANDRNNPTWFIFIVISANSSAYSSIVANNGAKNSYETGEIKVCDSLYYSDNDLQYQEPVTLVELDSVGEYDFDSVQPIAYKSPQVAQPGLVQIPIQFFISQYTMIASYMKFATDEITLTFKTKK